jgi:hypothetical protein
MLDAHRLHSSKALQAIGDHATLRVQVPPGKVRHRRLGKRLHVQAHRNRFAVGCCLHRSDQRHFVLRASAHLATGALATQVGVIHLHPTFEHPVGLALAHDFGELVLDQPGRAIANTEQATQLQRRDIVLGLGEQLHGQKPHRQGQLAGSKDGAAEQAGLATAMTALPVLAAIATKLAGVPTTATGANEPIGPASLSSAASHCSSVP